MDDGLALVRFRPDYAVPPGATLRETLERRGMSQADFARRADLSTKHVNQIMQGEAPITADTALALELVTEVPAQVWNGLEANYQAALKRLSTRRALTDGDRAWLRAMPVRDLIALRIIPDAQDPATQFESLLRLFAVANRHAWDTLWQHPDAAFRRSSAFQANPYATATWLRLAELRAADVSCAPFDRVAFKEAVREIRSWAREPITKRLIARMRDRLAAAGVALVIVEEVKGCRASGATRWISANKAFIALSLRYKRDDRFWFTFFHEAGHVLLHGKRQTFVDEERGQRGEVEEKETGEEREADRFAADVLIPRALEPRVRAIDSQGEIAELADELEIAPGVVVGRMQWLGVISWASPLNKVRAPIDPVELQSAARDHGQV